MSELTKQEKNRKTNKKVLGVLGVIFIILGVILAIASASGGSDSPNKTQEATSETTTGPVATSEPSKTPEASESELLDAVFKKGWKGIDTKLTAQQGINNTKVVCKRLNNGDDIDTIFIDLLELTNDPSATGYILGAAADGYCPQHKDTIMEVFK